jgi:Fe-S-cluster containining protein
MATALPILNAAEAKYECIFGRGCDGICCQNGRPAVYADEAERIDVHLDKFLPHLRPAARKAMDEAGYLSRRMKLGQPMMRVVDGWCIFFNQGCVLHKVGAEEGDKYRYKPSLCALFPLAKDERGNWYVRQHRYKSEAWNLFCLDPAATEKRAVETLGEEIEMARRFEAEAAPAQPLPAPKMALHLQSNANEARS